PLLRGHCRDLLARPGVHLLEFLLVGGRTGAVVGGVGRIEPAEFSSDVAYVNHAVSRIEPGVLVQSLGQRPARYWMLLLGRQRVNTARDHHVWPLEGSLLEQRFEPRLELIVDVV